MGKSCWGEGTPNRVSEAFQISWTGLRGYRKAQGEHPRKLGGVGADPIDLSPNPSTGMAVGSIGMAGALPGKELARRV